MAETKGNTAVPAGAQHDRVAMLSVNKDGTLDQHDPEIIGDKDFALEATKEQFRQQAVSAIDEAKRRELGLAAEATAAGEQLEQDPAIAELQEAHEAAEKSAESAAEAAVGALYVGDEPAGGDQPAAAKVRTPAAPAKADQQK